jgi:hypothetical protein
MAEYSITLYLPKGMSMTISLSETGGTNTWASPSPNSGGTPSPSPPMDTPLPGVKTNCRWRGVCMGLENFTFGPSFTQIHVAILSAQYLCLQAAIYSSASNVTTDLQIDERQICVTITVSSRRHLCHRATFSSCLA